MKGWTLVTVVGVENIHRRSREEGSLVPVKRQVVEPRRIQIADDAFGDLVHRAPGDAHHGSGHGLFGHAGEVCGLLERRV